MCERVDMKLQQSVSAVTARSLVYCKTKNNDGDGITTTCPAKTKDDEDTSKTVNVRLHRQEKSSQSPTDTM